MTSNYRFSATYANYDFSQFHSSLFSLILVVSLLPIKFYQVNAQTVDANRSGFTWVSTENVNDISYGSGYTVYSAAWPVFKDYPGANNKRLYFILI